MALVGGASTLPFTNRPSGGGSSELEAREEGDSLAVQQINSAFYPCSR